MANVVFMRSKQLLLRESTHRKPARASRRHLHAMLLALENYVLDLMHHVIWKQFTTALAARDTQFNRMTRNLSHITDVDLQLRVCVLSRVRFFQSVVDSACLWCCMGGGVFEKVTKHNENHLS